MADYATLLRERVVLTCRSVDRIFLQAYVPKLQSVGLVCPFLRWQKHLFIPSSAAFGKIGDDYVAKVHKFAAENDIPVVYFDKDRVSHCTSLSWLVKKLEPLHRHVGLWGQRPFMPANLTSW